GFHHACTAAPLLADFDRDGDLDLLVASSQMRDWCAAKYPDGPEVRLYESDASTHGSFIGIALVGDGTSANSTASGAKVTVRTRDADGNEVAQMQELQGSAGLTSPDTVLFFGLGGCGAVHDIEVVWPDASRSTSRYENVQAGRFVELRQGDPDVHPMKLEPS